MKILFSADFRRRILHIGPAITGDLFPQFFTIGPPRFQMIPRIWLQGSDFAQISNGYAILSYVTGDFEAGLALIDRALALNPNLAAAWSASGSLRAFRGDNDLAIEHLARAMRLSPLDPLMFIMQSFTAFALFQAGRYDEAWPLAEKACREQPNFISAIRIAAASNAGAGRMEDARRLVARALELDPKMRISNLKDRVSPLRPDIFANYVEALREAGLPE